MGKTIAVIGATGTIGSAFSKSLATAGHRLLVFDQSSRKLNSLVRDIRRSAPDAQIEVMQCVSDASWEADIVIPDIWSGSERELANKIEAFTNRKIIIVVGDNYDSKRLQQLLPGAVFVKVSIAGEFSRAWHGDFQVCSSSPEAVQTVSDMLRVAGFNVLQVREPRKNFIQSKNNTMETTKWIIDPTHSELHFRIRHLMVSWVTGSFKKFDATVETDGDDLSSAKIHFTADIDSIFTNNDQRDAHLRTGDFFDAQNHPRLTFEGDKLERIDNENYILYGTLTMRGISKRIRLNVEHGGITTDPWGNTRTGFAVSGKINRKDFGVSFSMVSETGGVLLGDEVTISANVQFVKEVSVQTKAA